MEIDLVGCALWVLSPGAAAAMAPKRESKAKGKDPDEDRVHVVVRIRPPVRKDEKCTPRPAPCLLFRPAKHMRALIRSGAGC